MTSSAPLDIYRILVGSRRLQLGDTAKRVAALRHKGVEDVLAVTDNSPRIAVIIPCLNEAKNVEKAIKSACRWESERCTDNAAC